MGQWPAGWYIDPSHHGQQRYWDGTAWTQHVRAIPAPGASATTQAGAGGGTGVLQESSGGAGRLWLLVGGLAVLVIGAGIAALVVLSPFGGDEQTLAGDEQTQTTEGAEPGEDESEPDTTLSETAEDRGPPLSQVDLDNTELRVDHGNGPVTVELTGGEGVLEDGRRVRRMWDLTVRGDVTGDSTDEIVVVLAVARPDGAGEVPAVGVLTDDPERGATPLEPPQLAVPVRDGAWEVVEQGEIEAIGVHDGGIELALLAPPRGVSSLTFSDDRADPLVDNRRPEIRLTFDGAEWSAEADGPVTRAAAEFTARAGVPAQQLLCTGRGFRRGSNPTCIGSPMDGSAGDVEVSLLVVDDGGGFRGATGRPAPVSSATQVRRIMGPGDHLCRDIAAQSERDDLVWALPMAAVAYWFDEGMPDRMDAAQNGIPCQTVFDGVAAFLNGRDGVIGGYDAVYAP